MYSVCVFMIMISMVAAPISLIVWLVKKLRKKETKKAKRALLVSAACLVVFTALGVATVGTNVDTGSDKSENEKEQMVEEKAQVVEEKVPTVDEKKEPAVETVAVDAEAEYKESCIEIDYKDLCRYPDEHEGKKIRIEVKIQQIMSSKKWRALADNDGTGWYLGDEYYLADKRGSDAVKILEDDIIVVYGEFSGMETITRALTWTRDEVPRINVKYIDFVEFQTCEEIYEEYAQKIQDEALKLLEEFKEEARENKGDIEKLAEINSEKTSELAEVENEGIQKMAANYSNAGETYDDYTEWSGKLWDVYLDEVEKFTEAYMNAALG